MPGIVGSQIIELKASEAVIDFGEYLSEVRTFIPSLDEDDTWIRSGIYIKDNFKPYISSYRLFGSRMPKTGHARIEVLLVKAQVGISLEEAIPHSVEFVIDHLTASGCDAAFAAIVSSTGSGWKTFFIKSPIREHIEIPEDILTHTCAGALKPYIKKACGLSDPAIDGFFSMGYALFDDTIIRAKAREIDKALRYLKFCDIAAGSGQMIFAMADLVTELRLSLNKYLGSTADRTEKNFAGNFFSASLYAADFDAGAIEILKTEIRMKSDKKIDDSRFAWGNILTEDLFEGTPFDVVATNPPHMKSVEFSSIKEQLAGYDSYPYNADLYCFYAERAFGLTTEGGGSAVLMSNRWMRSGYGEGLRGFLSRRNITEIVDYSDIPAAKGIHTPLSIVAGSNDAPRGSMRVTVVEEQDYDNLSVYVEEEAAAKSAASLEEKSWILDPEEISSLMKKMDEMGIPLGDYTDGGIYRGILTGLNEAFSIDKERAEELIKQDPNSAKILKPFLSGRHVKRYAVSEVKKYLIFLPKGITDSMRGESDPWEWLEALYPAVAGHLKPFEQKASRRRDKGDYWWELRSCRYYDEFEKTKVICPTIVRHISATMDSNSLFSNDKTSIIASEDFYLLGLLNSSLIDFYMRRIAPELLNDHYEVKPSILARLPIKKISPTNSFHVNLKTEIENGAMVLSKLCSLPEEEKDDNVREDIRQAERAINKAAAKLYRLTPNEISLVENY